MNGKYGAWLCVVACGCSAPPKPPPGYVSQRSFIVDRTSTKVVRDGKEMLNLSEFKQIQVRLADMYVEASVHPKPDDSPMCIWSVKGETLRFGLLRREKLARVKSGQLKPKYGSSWFWKCYLIDGQRILIMSERKPDRLAGGLAVEGQLSDDSSTITTYVGQDKYVLRRY